MIATASAAEARCPKEERRLALFFRRSFANGGGGSPRTRKRWLLDHLVPRIDENDVAGSNAFLHLDARTVRQPYDHLAPFELARGLLDGDAQTRARLPRRGRSRRVREAGRRSDYQSTPRYKARRCRDRRRRFSTCPRDRFFACVLLFTTHCNGANVSSGSANFKKRERFRNIITLPRPTLDLDRNWRSGYLPDRLSRHMHVLRSKNVVRPWCDERALGALAAPALRGGLPFRVGCRRPVFKRTVAGRFPVSRNGGEPVNCRSDRADESGANAGR